MASLKDVVNDAKVEDLHKVLDSPPQRFLCYTKLKEETWILGVSDGIEIWQAELDKTELEEMRDLANVSRLDAYFTKFRSAFLSNQVDVSQVGIKVILTVGQGPSAFSYDLYEMKSAEKKIELQTLLFTFADMVASLESKLKSAQQNVDSLAKQKGSSKGFLDFDTGKKTVTKAQPKKAGMSVINPTSKKRKAAHGVVFD